MNNVVNRFHDWPLPQHEFQKYVEGKYRVKYIHHYEKTQDSGKQKGDAPQDYSHKIEVNSDTLVANRYQM